MRNITLGADPRAGLGGLGELAPVGEGIDQRRLADVRSTDDRQLGLRLGQLVETRGRLDEAELERTGHRHSLAATILRTRRRDPTALRAAAHDFEDCP